MYLQFGVWLAFNSPGWHTGALTIDYRANCRYDTDNDRICTDAHHGYSVFIQNADKSETVDIGASWTRGLAVHPVGKCLGTDIICGLA